MGLYHKQALIPIITGPTASGKTGLSLQLASALDGAVVSCDSMQIYRGLDIGTAKATPAEQALVPHYLIDIRDVRERFSVQDFLTEAEAVLQHLDAEGRWPILVGGTPQYITSLVEGIRFMPDGNDPALRARLQKRCEQEGSAPLLEELARLDPERAAKLHPNDHRRIVRALEIALSGSMTQSEWDRPQTREKPQHRYRVIALDWPREALYARINARVEQMFADGLLDEARYLKSLNLPSDCTSIQAIGYKELFAYLDGEISLDEAKEHLKRQSRRYAKRQLTWFRAKDWIEWIKPESLAAFLPSFTEELKASAQRPDQADQP